MSSDSTTVKIAVCSLVGLGVGGVAGVKGASASNSREVAVLERRLGQEVVRADSAEAANEISAFSIFTLSAELEQERYVVKYLEGRLSALEGEDMWFEYSLELSEKLEEARERILTLEAQEALLQARAQVQRRGSLAAMGGCARQCSILSREKRVGDEERLVLLDKNASLVTEKQVLAAEKNALVAGKAIFESQIMALAADNGQTEKELESAQAREADLVKERDLLAGEKAALLEQTEQSKIDLNTSLAKEALLVNARDRLQHVADVRLTKLRQAEDQGLILAKNNRELLADKAADKEEIARLKEALQLAMASGIGDTKPAARKERKQVVRPCSRCGTETHRRCAGCKTTFYCDKACQRAAWFGHHKLECPRLDR